MHLDNKLNWDIHISKLDSKFLAILVYFIEFEST